MTMSVEPNIANTEIESRIAQQSDHAADMIRIDMRDHQQLQLPGLGHAMHLELVAECVETRSLTS
jgi:hypothetical protein